MALVRIVHSSVKSMFTLACFISFKRVYPPESVSGPGAYDLEKNNNFNLCDILTKYAYLCCNMKI